MYIFHSALNSSLIYIYHVITGTKPLFRKANNIFTLMDTIGKNGRFWRLIEIHRERNNEACAIKFQELFICEVQWL